jgi:hypothetical protein
MEITQPGIYQPMFSMASAFGGGNASGKETDSAENVNENTKDRQSNSEAKAERAREQEIQREVQRLRTKEMKVKAHELAHKAVGGQYAGAVHYQYKKGPDGKMYIVGGDVSIDVSREKDPEETIAKMRQVRAAALAPADPSPQDLAVAARASVLEMQAIQELYREASRADEQHQQPESERSISVYI